MTSGTSPFFTWHALGRPIPGPEALVLHFCTPAQVSLARRRALTWKAIVPRCAFAAVVPGPKAPPAAACLALIRRQAARLGLTEKQIVMIGEAQALPDMLDLALRPAGAAPHAVMIDMPRDALPMVPGNRAGTLRFVQHRLADDPDTRIFESAIRALRRAGCDIRTILLPDGAGPLTRAIATFLVELVAIVCRSPVHPDPEQKA
jgi:hypothetical protein